MLERWLPALVVLALLGACATPGQRLDEQASRLGFARQVLVGRAYRHVVYRNAAADVRGNGSLHVYLDGDGTPWQGRTRVAPDPTPRNPLVLRLMAQDAAPALYLGRPCYHGQARVPPCTPRLWTAGRYAAEVVDSMAAALRRFLEQDFHAGIVFIGYSGGGALAMLLAERFAQTRAVLTVAGNLDPPRWAAWHDYSPLTGSLNPATRSPLPRGIVQLHFAGGRDENVPPHLIDPVVSRQRCAKLVLIENFDHVCCWQATWSAILEQLQTRLQREPGQACGDRMK